MILYKDEFSSFFLTILIQSRGWCMILPLTDLLLYDLDMSRVDFPTWIFSSLQSTYENFRYQYSRRANPYNKGIVRNFLEIFCSSIPASKNNFRAKVQKKPVMPSHSVGDSFGSTNLANAKREQGKAVWDEPINRVLAIGSNRITLADGNHMTENRQ